MRRIFLSIILGIFITNVNAQDIELLSQTEQKNFSALREYDLNSVSSTNFDVSFYRCNWTVDPAVRFISGSVASYFTITTATNNIVYDFNKAMTVDSVVFRGAKITFTHTFTNALRIDFPITLPANQKDSVAIFYKGVPPNSGAFTMSTHNTTPIIWTLSEPYGASTWWPCKDMLHDNLIPLTSSSPIPLHLFLHQMDCRCRMW